jgi:hypothetical protein
MILEHNGLGPLLDTLVRVTKTLLEKQGTFLPHGAMVLADGQVALVGAQTKEEQPGAQKALLFLESGLRGMATQGKCIAVGIALDTRLKAAPRQADVGKDAIWVMLEHKDGTSMSIFIPYAKTGAGIFAYEETFRTPRKQTIFSAIQ